MDVDLDQYKDYTIHKALQEGDDNIQLRKVIMVIIDS